MPFKVPERYRVTAGAMASGPEAGNNGCFVIPLDKKWSLFVIASDGLNWEHVSVHAAARKNLQQIPTWNQMCKVKDLFWGPDDVVIQFHPAKKDYVNNHPHVLHMWRPTAESGMEIPVPPAELVGIRKRRTELFEPGSPGKKSDL